MDGKNDGDVWERKVAELFVILDEEISLIIPSPDFFWKENLSWDGILVKRSVSRDITYSQVLVFKQIK